MTSGGPGRNQGRKPINGKCARIKISITVDPENLKWLGAQYKSRSDTLDALMRQARDLETDPGDGDSSLQESISKIRDEDFEGQNDVAVYLDLDRAAVYCSAYLSADLQLFSVKPGCRAESVRESLRGMESALTGLIESNKSKNFNKFRFWSTFISGGRPQLSYRWDAEDWFQTPAP